MNCPNCGLVNSESAQRCDCGYDFSSKTIKGSYLAKSKVDKIPSTKKQFGMSSILLNIIWHPTQDSLIHVVIFILSFNVFLLLIDAIFTEIYSNSLLSSLLNLCFLFTTIILILMIIRRFFIKNERE